MRTTIDLETEITLSTSARVVVDDADDGDATVDAVWLTAADGARLLIPLKYLSRPELAALEYDAAEEARYNPPESDDERDDDDRGTPGVCL